MLHKPYTPPTFPVSFSKPSAAVSLGVSQAEAIVAATVPAPATKTRKQIEPHVSPDQDWCRVVYEEPEIDETFQATVDSIVLAGNDYTVLTRLQSGTIRTDRRSASPDELESMENAKRQRQQNRYDTMGSSQTSDQTPPTSPSTSEEKHT
jgi:hypothetical protein